ncbi:hypothetical protein ONE63_001242 [Megalurothrips usitatus]|uniref:Multidrug resistance-associated protein 4-like n=1 Tax=Megalurothrips usitatus TaxID=439358 RepID=A0AAV7XFK5_9NEOP|nr:hypothetical protein ONE63_001242 [Megalurothrips usitatus]
MDKFNHKMLKNPRVGANPLSVAIFAWSWPTFWKGYRKQLDIEDLYEPLTTDQSERLGDKLEAQWQSTCESARRKGGTPSLLAALTGLFWKKYLAVGILDAANSIGLKLVQPLLLGELLKYFSPGSTMSKEHALYYAAGITACILLSTVIANHTLYWCMHLGMQMRIACCSLIFRKATKLSRTALGETASGQVVNLLSNDVSRFDIMSIFLNHLWIDPALTLIVAYLLYLHVGWAAFVGIGSVFIVVPLQSYTGALSSKFRHKIAVRTDKRVRFMDEIVNGVQVIKMYAWEKPFTKLISEARRMEIKEILKVYMVRGVFMSFMLFTTRVALFSTLITYALTGSSLKASMVFVVQSYYNTLSMTMGSVFVRGISEVAECVVSIRRLQTFLGYEEYDAQRGLQTRDQARSTGHDNPGFEGAADHAPPKSTGDATAATIQGPTSKSDPRADAALVFCDTSARWSRNQSEDTLRHINLCVPRGELLAIIGPVGSGKSSMLQAVLGELATTAGSLDVRGKVSYACQEPWLFSASVRQNITFGSAFDRKRYDRVVRACALLADFAQFPFGDLTLVGERGSSLSGGQKARVNLARAVYREADVYLLDDPLSAVDTHVGKHLFDECVVKLLAGKTRILVTHQVQYLSEVNHIAILSSGEIQMQGTFKELLNSDVDYAKMLHLAENEDEEEEEEAEAENRRPLLRALRQLSRVSTRSLELQQQGSRRSSVSLRSSTRRSSIASVVSPQGDVVDEQVPSSEDEDDEPQDAPKVNRIEATTKGKVKGSLFFRYFLSGTNIACLVFLMAMFLAAQAAGSCADAFVAFWTNQEELRNYRSTSTVPPGGQDAADAAEQPLTSTVNFVYIYTGIIVALFVLAFTRSFFFYWVCARCSQALHDSMFGNIIRATMHFFNTNPSGRILNRFSKDLGGIDELLPKALLDASQYILSFFGYIIVSLSVNWEFIVPVIVLLVVFYLTRVIYLKSSKNIKRMEGMTRSPVFTHLNATIQGLSTIRAFGAQDLVKAEFDNHQNLHTSAWFTFVFTSTSFGTALDLLSFLFSVVVIFSFLLLQDGTGASGGNVGLAITQSMAMTGLVQFGMRQSAEVASQLLSVERALEYADLPTEGAAHSPKGIQPKPDWPKDGRLEMKNVWMRYAPEDPPVLKGLNLVINPMEKVGIVGRTGAGKSSLISALFRLAYLEGQVTLDDVDTGAIPLQQLRSKMSIIPQDPVLFSGSLRKNLDPFDEYKDHQLWAALEDVELRDTAAEAEGLEMRVADSGSNFSVGQRQLICLARAILRGNKLLMLDEATANVDPQTDALIQSTIRTKFARCTVLTVAHRLNTIMDSDRVLVMDAGRAAEFDHPHMLMQKRGIFYALVQETGHQMAENLGKIARENYENKISSGQY